MDEDGCGFSRLWNILSHISLDDVVLSFYYWDYLQVGLFTVADNCSASVD